jgi:anti-anti-sigma factor
MLEGPKLAHDGTASVAASAADNDRARARWIVVELDARGEIDEHAAMCLQFSVRGAVEAQARAIVIDLRDLMAIDAPGVALFERADADCRARGISLGLLISADQRHDAIAGDLEAAGLVDRLLFAVARDAVDARAATRRWIARPRVWA